MKKAFTLIELVVAIALLAMVFAFTAAIFQVGISSYRTAAANAEIMQKLRAITDQLNADFEGLQKDGYLLLRFVNVLNRKEFDNSVGTNSFRSDKIYYFSTGDFQSWFDPNVRSNIARIYFGHDSSFSDSNVPVSKWNLARDAVLLTPGNSPPPLDCNDVSFAECKVDLTAALKDPNVVLNGVMIDIDSDPNDVRRLMCQNAGQMRIEWTDGTITGGNLQWNGTLGTTERWTPRNQANWPKALKFTFTLYDSKAVLKQGRVFTHIVYLKN